MDIYTIIFRDDFLQYFRYLLHHYQNYLDNKNIHFNTTQNSELNGFTIICFFLFSIIGAFIFFIHLFHICNTRHYILFPIFLILWAILQWLYLDNGLNDCFGTKHHTCRLYAHAHNIFFLTSWYIFFSLFLFYFIYIWLYTSKLSHVNDSVISLVGIVTTFSAISLSGHISSINSMVIVLSIFLLIQSGFLYCIL